MSSRSVSEFLPLRNVKKGKHVRFLFRLDLKKEGKKNHWLFKLVLGLENSVIVPKFDQPSESLARELEFAQGGKYYGKIYLGSIERGDNWTLGPVQGESGISLVDRVDGWLAGLEN
ncbi:hypothetical protein CYLTODRAFT_415263 [Cylindrobasidium torrendii FP15055 ss-10]|uniref:Uncharacterized protein n=1 Tax=Cylindrobasidium torrendii FP15055 ss-10 TaxID=1314674 RepID=A0A0D7ATM0_9AGAR|nr:hypothetical protein CYLTODRAFT_415263 [Cylindrobasidium torrendii FP15055 ss-10]